MAERTPPPPRPGPEVFAAGASRPPAPNPFAAGASSTPTTRTAPRRPWRALGWVGGLLTGLVTLLLVAAAALWWWLGSPQSLATALTQAAARLPAGQQLESREVSGTLRSGGHIGWLRWRSPSLTVEAHDIRIGWSLAPLLQRSVQLGEVQVAAVHITPTPQPGEATPPQPLEQLVLPVRVDVPFQIGLLHWHGAPTVQAQALAGRYRHDRTQHTLEISGVDLAQGHYRAQATLQAQAPMQLEATLEGEVHTTPPGSTQPLALSAHATLQGPLAGAAAQLQLAAQLSPGTDTPPSAAHAMQAEVSANIAPWAPQPLRQAQATLRAVNLTALWPQAPTTALQGTVQAGPRPEGWSITAALQNGAPGPWDQQKLPLSALNASALYDGTRWNVPQARLQVGSGSITLQGHYAVADTTVEGSAQVQGLSPAAVHSQLDASPLAGQVRARTQGDTVHFNLDVQAAARAATKPSSRTASAAAPIRLRLQSARASGTWRQGLLSLQTVDLQALQARLQGQSIAVTLGAAPSARGTLTLTLPGATASASGTLGQDAGAGQAQLVLEQAERTQAWLQTLPGIAQTLGGRQLQGQARLDARWQGGWNALRHPWQAATGKAPATPAPKGDFRLDATLATPRLDITLPPPAQSAVPTRVQLRNLKARLEGSLAQATLALDGQAQMDGIRADLGTRLSGGLGNRPTATTPWRAEVSALRLQVQAPERPGPWVLQLDQPLALTLRQPPAAAPGAARNTLQAAEGQATISGPLPGRVALRWQPTQLGTSASGALQLQTRGTLAQLPLAWADALAAQGQTLADLGLGGNLVLQGEWDVQLADTLRASARLQRSSGDLRVNTDGSTGGSHSATATPATVPATTQRSGPDGTPEPPPPATHGPGTWAGVRQASVQLDAEGGDIRARIDWDSERAGTLQADARTTLARTPAPGTTPAAAAGASTDSAPTSAPGPAAAPTPVGWYWPANAPVAARVQARLPDLGVWSALAPPGWRVQGTLNADATLSGTRSQPQWHGTLGADQLAVRSLADGVDLQDGRLRGVLRGNRLDITEFTLHGGSGSSARIAGYSGNRTPAPRDGGRLQGSGSITWVPPAADAPAGAGIGMQFTAEAHALQVQVRADRQASVSGTLRGSLAEGLFTLRGQLTVDRATLLLPDETAPRLGTDVVVRSAARDAAAQQNAQAAARSATRAQTARAPDIAITIDLGTDFALQGQGITTRLEGVLDIRSAASANAPPRVTGEIRTVQGRYRAWGQMLDVESGLIRFNGPYNNPSLDILALRPNISVRAGVQVQGTALAPRVRLVSEPDLPDAEKLAWVVLGRSAATGGAEAAVLQQAALALLGGKGDSASTQIASRLGLDEIGFKGPGTGEDATGAALTLGKRLSKDLYVTYERSLSGTLGTLYIFYDLSRNLTLRGQTGSTSAVDLIHTLRFD
ncbi:translocation/assembly module TamB domain-containing protein [Diaphorobacter sp.]|uniref:translocation/assembly module TamB domain-containing protein n=1 Tax=Diaphorobacter sp. TaxID=1934310 RepID=UPI0025883380|nr:translocation/assembly module TamB domain-containing protein [Diaphorobacter sp.]